MVAGPSPHSSAYAAGDRLACRRAATHRWLSPWGWRRWRRRPWRRWSRLASCWPSPSTGRRPAGSTRRHGRGRSAPPAAPGAGRGHHAGRRPGGTTGPAVRSGACPAFPAPAGRARAGPAPPAPATPDRPQAARGPTAPGAPPPGPERPRPAESDESSGGWPCHDRHRREGDSHRRWPGRDRPHPDKTRPALAGPGPGRARASPFRPRGPPVGRPGAASRPAVGRVPPQPSTQRQNGWPAGSR